MKVVVLTIPTPETLIEILWFGLGITFARGFGKRLDEDIQESDYYKNASPFIQGILKRILDVTHHWWMGLFLIIYCTSPITIAGFIFNTAKELVWFGWGVFYDDVPDLPLRIQGYFGIPEDERRLNIYKALPEILNPEKSEVKPVA